MQQDRLIEAFKRRLQSDPKLFSEFLQSPLGVVKREGVQMSPPDAMRLRDEMSATTPKAGKG
jgi:hypothetical protein